MAKIALWLLNPFCEPKEMWLRLSYFKKSSGGETNRGIPPALGENDEHVQDNVRCTPGPAGGGLLFWLHRFCAGGGEPPMSTVCGPEKGGRRRKNGSVWTFFTFQNKR